MLNIKKISESEMEIMRIIWSYDEPVTSALIYKDIPKEREWAQSTILTFLSRLCKKGMITSVKNGNANVYTAIVSESQYRAFETRCFLDSVHSGSPRSFVASLFEDETMNRDELENLKKWFLES